MVQTHLDFLLHLADNALILGQRNAEWCGHGPILEEDLAMANNSLDLIGQARLLYQQVAEHQGHGCTEDQLAYFRDESAFRNFTLLELPHSAALAPRAKGEPDYAVTIARHFLFSVYMVDLWAALAGPAVQKANPALAAIAAKSYKETEYHLRHASDWVLRMGDGTTESHQRLQQAFEHLMPYTQEFWRIALPIDFEIDQAALQSRWEKTVSAVLNQATLTLPSAQGFVPTGSLGQHSEHMGYLLNEMQGLARAHPGAVW